MAKSNTAVAIQLTADSANDALPAHLQAVEGAGRGNENVGNAVTIPRLKLLQKMNNEVDKHHGDYIDGCDVGDFINNLTKQNYGSCVYALSLHFNNEYAVWRDIKKGGGYGGTFSNLTDANEYISKQEVPDEWSADETHGHVLLLKDPNTGELSKTPIVMDFAKSKLRVSKAWNSQIAMKGGDRFAGLWKIAGVSTENKSGQTFMNADVSWVGWAVEDDYKQAEAMYEQFA